jgi:hypothetical protein
MRGDEPERPLVVREGLDELLASAALGPVDAVDWDSVAHAYGPARDVPGQLAAVIAGDDASREEAWWNLWGNVHHQGSTYPATLHAVPVLFAVAGWPGHPDRAEALFLLRAIAATQGIEVWVGDGAHDDEQSRRLTARLRATLDEGAAPLLARWREEPEAVRRALLMLLPALPGLRERHGDLVAALLPAEHRRGWEVACAGTFATDEEGDALDALEAWADGRE